MRLGPCRAVRLLSLALEGGGGHRIVNNVLSANGGAGLASGGVLLWASDANALIDNRIARHSRLGAAGILLFGAAEANRLEGNVLTGNASGVRLLPDPTAARPAGNELVANRLENSQRLGLLSLGRRNSYRDNLIASNNGLGALLFESEGERFSGNVFRDNGKAGLEAVRVARLRLEGNRFEGNAAGTIATGLARSELRANVFEGNAGEAVNLLQGERLRFSENVVRGQGRDGFVMRATRALVLSGNAFSGNAPVDALLERVTEAEIFENAFAEGLALWEGAAFRLARNRLPAAGLWPWETAELDARANFWGGPAGPRRSLVLGPEVAFPWAPVPPEEIVPGTLVGWRAAELGDWVHVPGRGLALAPAEPAARGWLIGFVPAAASAPVTPAWRFALIGEAERTVRLRWATAELPQATGLSLWSREAGGTWQSLELEADEDGLQAHLRLRPLVPTVIVLGVAG